MALSSLSSNDGLNMPAKLRNLYSTQKLAIDINVLGKRKVYTTLDKLEGAVSITAPVDTSFDDIEIELVGTSRTYVERLTTAAAVSGRSEAFHQFLKLQQPRMQQYYPEDRILKANKIYTFPFVFVIPQQLLPRVCRHRVVAQALRDYHVQLPPTFGDKDSSSKSDASDDMVPDMASIRYGIFARVSKDKEHGEETSRTTITSKAKRIRVIPAGSEQPPLDISGEDNEYIMRKEKIVRKGVLKGKLGSLVMEASQPPSLRLRLRSDPESQATSIATIMLRFDPVDDNAPPPRLGSLSSKLKVCTFFASTARGTFPSKNASLADLSQGLHAEQLNLSSRCMTNVEWTKHSGPNAGPSERRDSSNSGSSLTTGNIPDASSAYKNKSYYTARLLVPVSLPTNKTFVPTFHTCLISRIYQLKLELGVQTAGIGGSMDLKIPLQMYCEAPSDPMSHRGSVDSSMETDVDIEDISDFFQPRTIGAPSTEFIGRSRIGSSAPVDEAPPGYSFFNPRTHSDRAHVPVY